MHVCLHTCERKKKKKGGGMKEKPGMCESMRDPINGWERWRRRLVSPLVHARERNRRWKMSMPTLLSYFLSLRQQAVLSADSLAVEFAI